MELEKSIGVRPIISSIVLVTTLLVIADRPAPIESAALQDASDIEAKAQVSNVILRNIIMEAKY